MSDTSKFLEFSKPFVDGIRNVFETMVFTKVATQKPSLKQGNTSKGDVSAVLGMTGEVTKDGEVLPFKGMLVLSWPLETYLKVAGAMLMAEYSEYNDEIADVGAEISNMIMGNAKRDLTPQGYKLDMSIPSMISGKDHNINYPNRTVVVEIPIESDHGVFYMELCYKE